jgi:uracil permease
MNNNVLYQVEDKVPFGRGIFYGLQHLLAFTGACILAPMLMGVDPLRAIFTAGIGTLTYLFITKFKITNITASSFAFIACGAMTVKTWGIEYLAGGCIVSCVLYIIVSLLVRKLGTDFLNKILPATITGPICAVIGLSLAGTAVSMSSMTNGVFDIKALIIAFITIAIIVTLMVQPNKFIRSMSIILGMILGCIFAAFFGYYHLTLSGNIFHAPIFIIPHFNLAVILLFSVTSISTIAEHVSTTIVTGSVVGRDYVPILKNTILGDGVATGLAAFFSGIPNTTYSENVGVLATTKVYSVYVAVFASIIAIIVSFIQPFGDLLGSISIPVLGGACTILYGVICAGGLKQLIINNIDLDNTKNLIIVSLIFVIGVGNLTLQIPIAGQDTTLLNGIAFAAIVGIAANLLIPEEKNI